MKYGWYAHFWSVEVVYVCFPREVFRIPREAQWISEGRQQVRQYGVECGVAERCLDLRIED
jgi:hypothetical protein